MKVVLDTNILVSGTFWKGDSSRIIEFIENDRINLIISQELIDEYNEVIEREEIMDKILYKNLILNKSVQKIIQDSILVSPSEKFNYVQDDADDNKILECAYEGKADYIITKDNHLLNLKEFQGIKIITPYEFLKLL